MKFSVPNSMSWRVLRQRPKFHPLHKFGKKFSVKKRKAITAKSTRKTADQNWLPRLWQSPDKVGAFGIKKGEVKQVPPDGLTHAAWQHTFLLVKQASSLGSHLSGFSLLFWGR